MIAEQPPDFTHADFQNGVAHVHIGPDRVQELILCDDPRPLANEVQKDRQRLRRETQWLTVPPQPLADRVDDVRSELQAMITGHRECRNFTFPFTDS